MTLTDAITAVEQADTAYNGAVATTTNDQAAADAIKAKLDAATATVSTDQAAQDSAKSTRNSALDDLIAAATAAKL